MSNEYYIMYNGTSMSDWDYGSAAKDARRLSKEYGKAEVITEEPYWYKGYRFWVRSKIATFIDGEYVGTKPLNVLLGWYSGKYVPVEEWKKEQDEFFRKNMSEDWLKKNGLA